MIGLLIVCAAIFYRDYGMQWDSSAHTVYGERVLDYWLCGGKDHRTITDVGLLNTYGA